MTRYMVVAVEFIIITNEYKYKKKKNDFQMLSQIKLIKKFRNLMLNYGRLRFEHLPNVSRTKVAQIVIAVHRFFEVES